MSEFQLQELLAYNRELITDTWNFFLTVHLAVFGIVHIASRRVVFLERMVLYGAYFGFLTVNYFAQRDNYDTYLQLSDMLAQSHTAPAADGLKMLIPKGHAVWVTQGDNLLYVYAGAAALSVLVILFTSRGHRND